MTEPQDSGSLPEGLTTAEAVARLVQDGSNSLPSPPLPGKLQIFGRQFLSPFIYLLFLAAMASFLLQQVASGVFILVVLLVNASIGCIQEFSAQQAAVALRNMVRGSAKVFRDGVKRTIDSESVVRGDIVLLSSGDKVPADGLLLSSQGLVVDESMLTGESLGVTKDAYINDQTPQDGGVRRDSVYAGTLVTRGRGIAQVTQTGSNTQIGKIADEVLSPRESRPPLLIRIDRFTYQVAAIILIAIAILAVLMLSKGIYGPTAIFLMAVGLAVSVIPEGLPAALTVALAIGMRRMAESNVIIRRLVAVEALGSCTLICSDKTGTLTVNELTIQQIILPNGKTFSITGEGVAPGGEIQGEGDRQQLDRLVRAGVYANESQLEYAGGDWTSQGDIVDVAFLVLAKKYGLSLQALQSHARLGLMPYESEKAYSASINVISGQPTYFIKGSPEKVLSLCKTMQDGDDCVPLDMASIMAQVERFAARGLRLIALAACESNTVSGSDVSLEPPNDLVYLGMVGMIDPVRESARVAVAQCLQGGIEVAMITGDHPATARAIALQLGLCSADDKVVTGAMIHQYLAQAGQVEGQNQKSPAICPPDLSALICNSRVFARIEPQQKELIVKVFMDAGHFVAVTGDGVNDAPAMRAAHTAVAMGLRGTDVARETADLIITDDNFASIVAGIREGRVVYNNIRKVIGLLVATGFSIILLFFLCVLSGLPMPMIAVQLLWLNLVANGLQDVALAFEPSEGHETGQPPRDPKEPIFNRSMIEHVLVAGSVMGFVAFVCVYLSVQGGLEAEKVRNLTLMLMVIFGNIHALSSRSAWQSIFKLSPRKNLFLLFAVPSAQIIHILAMYTPGVRDVLALSPISFAQWGQLFLAALSLLLVEEVHKFFIRRRRTIDTPAARSKKPIQMLYSK